MTDEMEPFEKDLNVIDEVYGTHEDIGESLNAFMAFGSTFGKDVLADLVATINTALPFMAEVEAARPKNAEEVAAFFDTYFGTPEKEAHSYDMMAEAIKVAQRWTLAFLDEHGLKVVILVVPSLRGGLREWTFGLMSNVRAQTDVDTKTVRLAATTVVERPQNPPGQPGPLLGPDNGYL